MIPIGELGAGKAGAVRYVLFDIDDTITKDGYLLAESFDALWKLKEAGFVTVPVTGRPAGWCDLIARQWPVSGVVGENGAFAFYQADGKLERLYHPSAPSPEATATRLEELGAEACTEFPGLRIAKDQRYRLFDVALDFAEEEPNLGLDFARSVQAFCVERGAIAKVSSIHVNAWFGQYDKLSMAEYFLSHCFGYDTERDEARVLYCGDSPNDEPMFRRFSLSCGVANVLAYKDLLRYKPKYVTSKPYGYGFAEIVDILLQIFEKR